MLISAGKLSSIGEMLTIKFAASEPPGERHVSIFASFSVSVHLGGTVQDIPCRSHLTVWPPARAAVCAPVGVAFSAWISLSPLPEPPELLDGFSLLVRLQSERANPRTSKTGRCFMFPLAIRRLKEHSASIPKRGVKSNARQRTGQVIC